MSSPNTTTTTTPRTRPGDVGHISRVPNAFILARAQIKIIIKGSQGTIEIGGTKVDADATASDISRIAGAWWNKLSKEDKAPFYKEAARRKAVHQIEHPNYKYRPSPRGRKPAKATRPKETSPTKQAKIKNDAKTRARKLKVAEVRAYNAQLLKSAAMRTEPTLADNLVLSSAMDHAHQQDMIPDFQGPSHHIVQGLGVSENAWSNPQGGYPSYYTEPAGRDFVAEEATLHQYDDIFGQELEFALENVSPLSASLEESPYDWNEPFYYGA